jgi:hypothetical protein
MTTDLRMLLLAEHIEFDSLPAWVWYLGEIYKRQTTDTMEASWCPEWWEHPEAVRRLRTLWRAYDHLYVTAGPLWESDWWCLADLHMPVLTSPEGTFKYCDARHGHKGMLQALPLAPAPDWMFHPPTWRQRPAAVA